MQAKSGHSRDETDVHDQVARSECHDANNAFKQQTNACCPCDLHLRPQTRTQPLLRIGLQLTLALYGRGLTGLRISRYAPKRRACPFCG